jgi:putative glutamine amidotransferase
MRPRGGYPTAHFGLPAMSESRNLVDNRGYMRPLIGVTTSELRPSGLATLTRQGEPDHPEMALGMTYLQAIERAGGVPVVLPPCVSDLGALLARLDAVCLSGGPDLDPAAYGARTRHAELGPTEPSLDAFELALAREALERRVPLLGICRGSQALNVACVGTLHQHVDGHRQSEPGSTVTHEVDVQEGTRLGALIGAGPHAVNSFHHQAVDRVGEGLRVAARAAGDGTVEAVETLTGFAIGVQWHAETLTDGRLFEALVDAAAPGLRIAA